LARKEDGRFAHFFLVRPFSRSSRNHAARAGWIIRETGNLQERALIWRAAREPRSQEVAGLLREYLE
jgi:hypothetical protein